MHPEVQKLANYPNTQGKKIALEHFNYKSMDKVQEAIYANAVIKMAKRIDNVCQIQINKRSF